MAYLDPKGEGDKSMPEKPDGRVQMSGTVRREDPRDMAKAELPEP